MALRATAAARPLDKEVSVFVALVVSVTIDAFAAARPLLKADDNTTRVLISDARPTDNDAAFEIIDETAEDN